MLVVDLLPLQNWLIKLERAERNPAVYDPHLTRQEVDHAAGLVLPELLAEIEQLRKEHGLRVICNGCGKLLTEPGALRLYIGIPAKDGRFMGRKEHICRECVERGTGAT